MLVGVGVFTVADVGVGVLVAVLAVVGVGVGELIGFTVKPAVLVSESPEVQRQFTETVEVPVEVVFIVYSLVKMLSLVVPTTGEWLQLQLSTNE